MSRLGEYRKALAALLLAIGTWGVTAASDGISAGEWFGLLVALATGAGVAGVGNDRPKGASHKAYLSKDAGLSSIELLLIVLVVLVICVLFGVRLSS